MRPSSSWRQIGLALVWFLSLSSAADAAGTDLRLLNAVKDQNEQAARALLKEGVDVNAARADGATPLFWAVHWNDTEMVDPAAEGARQRQCGGRSWRDAAQARLRKRRRRDRRKTAGRGCRREEGGSQRRDRA